MSAADPVVGIVGSAGAYGRWLRRWLHDCMGIDSLGSDPADSASLAPAELVHRSDVLIFSAPVRATAAIIAQHAALAGARASSQLWMDLTSIKVAPVAAMLASGAEVVGLHPLTAPPKSPTLRGRQLVVCEAKLSHWRGFVSRFLAASEAHLVPMAADEHDRRMAVVQNLVHAVHLAQAAAMTRLGGGAGPAGLMDCRTVGFETDVATSARMLAGNAALYTDILLGNPHALQAVDTLLDELGRLREHLARGDGTALVEDHFARARHWFGAEAIAQGNYTFERVGYLLADLTDARALSVHLPRDAPGSLRELLQVFEALGISLDSVHSSRTQAGEVHFRFGFARATTDAQLQSARARIEQAGVGRVLPL